MAERARYDLLFTGGRVVDPLGNRHGAFDLAVKDGQVAEVAADLDPGQARQCFSAVGLTLMPGVVDTHVHASSWLGGPRAHAMMARAGVTTALDMSGPVESVLEYAARHGRGLNLAILQYVRPGHTVRNDHPGREELKTLLERSLAAGAIGLKILGGHYPLTPEATDAAIGLAHRRGAYLAFHAGTLATRSDLTGLTEAVGLAGDRPIHLAHINSYCRGRVRPCLEETAEALRLLRSRPQLFSESYLSSFNGTSGEIRNGAPESQVTVNCLAAKGFPPTDAGLEAAIRQGWAWVNREGRAEVSLIRGEEAAAYWRQKKTLVTLSFPVNPPEPRLCLATARNDDGRFTVTALSTDGGGIPRNVTVEMGLALVRLQALTLEEFVWKASAAPASALGLAAGRGHLSPGAWADITGLDLHKGRAALTVVGGRVVMYRGRLFRRGATIITTRPGVKAVREAGLAAEALDLADRPFYARTECRPNPE